MALALKFVTLLLFAHIEGQLVPHINFSDYIANIITHFARLESSLFDCWFLDVNHQFVGDIVSSPRIAHIPKVLASLLTFNVTRTIGKPSMVVLYANAYLSNPVDLVVTLYNSMIIEHDTKFLVLADFSSIPDVIAIYSAMFAKVAWNVVFVHIIFQLALVYNPFKNTVVYSTEMSPGIMFVDMTSNLYGTQVRYTLVSSSPWCALRESRVENGLVQGSVGNWVTETLRHINGTWYGVQLYCNPAMESCTKQYIFDEDGTPYDLLLTTIYLRKFLLTTLDLTEPVRLVILAPRGRMLKMFELFTYPFEEELWILIFVLLIACALLSAVFPNLFQNDPFMLSVCGFERYSLRLAKPHEKMVLFSLVVLFFFIKCAYENKFISLMTSYPRVRDPQTLDDLRRAGINIAVALGKNTNLVYHYPDPELRSLIEFVDDLTIRPKKMAIMAEVQMARVILHGDDYIDETTGDVFFMPLKGYSINLRVNSIVTVPKCPYRSKLRDSERRFFDAGLMQYWFEEMLYENMEFRRAYDFAKVRRDVDKVIAVSELQPVWILLAGGWMISVVVMVIETIWSYWTYSF
uniref:ionotropic receptor 124 precursor n=1 Tax=Aedes aegypti TaxID=7159 RepID=UPI000C285344|nr:ionotropic receptor 124 precursor [Aedes aegypti]